jgi:Rrf2 family iron-sulfur cluster assembly transcriptional regulator
VRLSQKAQYAICGSFDLAYHGGGDPVQVRVIGERQGIPERYLEQIFQSLRRARLVRGKRGPGGGYVLARPAAEISLADVIEAVEGPFAAALAAGPPARGASPGRPVFLFAELASGVERALAGLDLESLCREAARQGVPRAGAGSAIYQI